MTETTGFVEEAGQEQPVRRARPKQTKYRVRAYNPDAEVDKVVFADEDHAIVKNYVQTHHPRGREVYVEHPDGYREHYSADLHHQGSEPWQEFEEDE